MQPTHSRLQAYAPMPPGAHKDCTTDAIVHGVAWVTFALFLLGAAALLVLWSFMDESRTEPFVGCFFVCSSARSPR